MAFSGTMYSEVSAGAYQVDDLLKSFNERLSAVKQISNDLVSEMTAFATEWGPIQAAADALVTADPTDQSKMNLASHVANLVDDYNTINARAQAMAAAVNGI